MRTLPLLALLLILPGCLADLRTDALPTDPAEGQRQRGRALLQQAAAAHGLAAWNTYDTATLRLVNRWKNPIARTFAAPWGQRDMLEMTYRTDNNLGGIEIVQGPRAGETFRTGDEGEEAGFFLPAFRFLHGLPFFIKDAPVAVYEGAEVWNGRPHDVVFASYAPDGDVQPSSKGDQYRIYIDSATRLIDLVQYTVRAESKAATYWTAYDTLTGDGGVTLARLITVTTAKPQRPDPQSGVIHELNILSVNYTKAP